MAKAYWILNCVLLLLLVWHCATGDNRPRTLRLRSNGIELTDSNLTVYEGDTVSIDCEACFGSGNIKTLLHWYDNQGRQIGHNRPDQKRYTETTGDKTLRLVIQDVTSSDSGIYTCCAVNKKKSKFVNKRIRIVVAMPPTTTTTMATTPTTEG